MMSEPSLVGSQLGKYEVKAEIGRGGMGTVYLGYDPLLDRQLAIKVLAPHLVWNREFVERFLREARAAAKLKHPGIVIVHDVGQEGSWYYFVMEHLVGESLAACLQQHGALPVQQALTILRPLAAALDYAHYRGIVHRDVKPGNVILGPEGQVTLMDFGIARAAQEGRLTGTGTIVGTPEYMSPEQAKGLGVDARTDQYSLAVVAYQMLSGQVPFQADSTLALMYKVVHEPPPPLAVSRPDLPTALGTALEKALAKEPGERYPTATAFVDALEQTLTGSQVKAKGPAPDEETPTAVINRVNGGPVRKPGPGKKWLPIQLGRNVPGGVWRLLVGLPLLVLTAGLVIYFMSRPVVSAADTRLAFISDRDGHPQIYVMDGKGQTTRLTRHTADDRDVAWSPDKTRLVFASTLDGNWEIYWMNADGTGLTRVTDNPARDVEPTWSPDGSYVAFTSNRDGKREVYVTSKEGVTRVTHSPGNSESWEPAWGPDGSLFFASDRDGKQEVYHTTSAGGVVRMTHSPLLSSSWSPAWGWEGSYTLFVSNRDERQEIYAIMPKGELTRITHTSSGQGSWEPTASVFGRQIAFTSDRDGHSEIYAVTEGGTLQLTQTPNGGQSWSPAW